ncbi:MAG: hypothetical protein QXO32_09060 [Candidatus Bathyarchaeia archaeon]
MPALGWIATILSVGSGKKGKVRGSFESRELRDSPLKLEATGLQPGNSGW